jgi:hypothetical protein
MKKTIEIKTITTFTFAHLICKRILFFTSSRTLSTFYAAKAQSFIRIKAMTFDAPSQQ